MRRLLILLFSAFPAFINAQDSAAIRKEHSHLEQLAAFVKVRHSTLFFHGITGSGYLRDGSIYYFEKPSSDLAPLAKCGRFAVSRDGTRIAVSAATGKKYECRIVIRDLATGNERRLAEGEFNGALNWSWDDSQILTGLTREATRLLSISTSDGSVTEKFTFQPTISNLAPAILWADYSHAPSTIIVTALVCKLDQRNRCESHDTLFRVTPQETKPIGKGNNATVSPKGGRIATMTGASLILFDESLSTRITDAPRNPYPPFLREAPVDIVVWSRDGSEVMFSTSVDEYGSENLYLVDIAKRRRTKLLNKTTVEVVAWR